MNAGMNNSYDYVPIMPRSTAKVFFKGRPSQAIHAPAIAKAMALFTVVCAVVAYTRVPVWSLFAALIVLGGWIGQKMARTACTLYTVDAERITVRRGVATKQVSSLELFRVQDVLFVQPWWQRPLGIGALVLDSSESGYSRWTLVGLRNAEAMRADLNRAAVALRQAKGIRDVNIGRV